METQEATGQPATQGLDRTEYKRDDRVISVKNDIDHSKVLINTIHIANISSTRYGSAKVRLNLINAGGLKDFPFKNVEEMEALWWCIANARLTFGTNGCKIENDEGFVDTATKAVIYTFQQYADMSEFDIRFTAGFYFNLGLGLLHAGYKYDDSTTAKDIDSLQKNGDALNSYILNILKLQSFDAEEVESIAFPERQIILQCFKTYVKNAVQFVGNYAENNSDLIKEIEIMFHDHNLYLGTKRRPKQGDRRPAYVNYFKCYSTFFPVMLETQLLAHGIKLDHKLRNSAEFGLMMQSAKNSVGIVQDFFTLAQDIKKFDKGDHSLRHMKITTDKPCYINPPTNNVIIIELLEDELDELDLKLVLEKFEKIYNSHMERIIRLGEDLIETHLAGDFVRIFKQVVSATFKMHYGTWAEACEAKLVTTPLSRFEKLEGESKERGDNMWDCKSHHKYMNLKEAAWKKVFGNPSEDDDSVPAEKMEGLGFFYEVLKLIDAGGLH